MKVEKYRLFLIAIVSSVVFSAIGIIQIALNTPKFNIDLISNISSISISVMIVLAVFETLTKDKYYVLIERGKHGEKNV